MKFISFRIVVSIISLAVLWSCASTKDYRYDDINEALENKNEIKELVFENEPFGEKFNIDTTIFGKIQEFVNLENLEIKGFTLNNYELKELVSSMTKLAKLRLFKIIDCALNEDNIPVEFNNLKNIEVIDLSWNNLTSVPGFLKNYTWLNFLKLSGNHLENLTVLEKLKNLKFLDLSWCYLNSVPNEICNLPLLSDIDLSNNKITSIPENLCNLDSLIILDLSYNSEYKDYEGNIQYSQNGPTYKWTNKKIDKCYLEYLPKNISKLKNLESLDLQFDCIPDAEIERLKVALPNYVILTGKN